ncbi:OmpA family protein [Caviibacter abscessus]|uniref:OmpA family protein n=1 Tax=Caviibacter abscessus TaxID=1766719 RepID=UPI00082F6934|nr:OmpA family protein [Caviibacter abscessus]
MQSVKKLMKSRRKIQILFLITTFFVSSVSIMAQRIYIGEDYNIEVVIDRFPNKSISSHLIIIPKYKSYQKQINKNKIGIIKNEIYNLINAYNIDQNRSNIKKNTESIKEIKGDLKTTKEKVEKNTKDIKELSDIAVKYDDKNKKKITLGENLNNVPVKISNLAAGTEYNDAVNYKQLKDTERQLSGGIASSMAMANIPQVGDNKLFSIGVGTAYYNKQAGFAFGISGTENTNTFVYKLSVGLDTQKGMGVAAGFNINFIGNGQKSSFASRSNAVYVGDNKQLQNEINNLKNENKEMKDMIKELKNRLDNMVVTSSNFKEKLYVIDQFINNKYIPTNSQMEKLKVIVKEINEKYSDRIIDITGHTDTNASEKYNLELGLQRANKVSDLLIKLGLKNPQNIRKVSSFGLNNKVNENLASNRRIEITIK